MDALFYGDPACVNDVVIQSTRREFTKSALLPVILRRMYQPPNRAATRRGAKFRGAKEALSTFAFDIVRQSIESELQQYERGMPETLANIDGDSLLAISMDGVVSDLEENCPHLVQSLTSALSGKNTARRTGDRNALHRRNMIGVFGSMILFARSQRQNQLQRKLAVYFKAKGTPKKVFDFLQSIGLTMSYKWTLDSIDSLADAAMADMRAWVATQAAIINMDNVLLVYPVQSQRIQNRTETINATACTVVKVPLAALPALNSYGAAVTSLRVRLSHLRVTDPASIPRLSFGDLLVPDADQRLGRLHIHYVLLVLRDAPGFDGFSHREDDVFLPPPPVRQLPTGPEHRTEYYMLQTEPFDEISYEGTTRCISAFMAQMGLDTPESKLRYATQSALPWGGDGLTTARMRALQRFRMDAHNGWDRLDWLVQYSCLFHELWWVAIDIHHNHYGTAAGNGLGREIKFLSRTGMAAGKKKPDFHTLDEMITQFWTASTLDCWLWRAGCDTLPELRAWAEAHTPAELLSAAEDIFFERQSTAALVSFNSRRSKNPDDFDEALYARTIADRDMAFYVSLRRSLKQGDIGVYIDAMPRLLEFYKGGGNSNYAREMYEAMQFLFKEATAEMRDFVFNHCLLVNLSGQPNRFMPTGQLQEHNNDKVKNNHSTHAASASMELVRRISPALPVMDAICKDVDANFTQLYHGTTHSAPNADQDVTRMLARFHAAEIHHFIGQRRCEKDADKPADFFNKGLKDLESGSWFAECWEVREVFARYASMQQAFDLPPAADEPLESQQTPSHLTTLAAGDDSAMDVDN
ncbi:hypothetical protein AURDEDRAFT_164831 [Auricularia subglabra TFB-10046 SS5]|nr:hypothetical protein AURDEDRAFT_164831 [Auricularia subglabra TFB-10046 SS5]